MTNVCGVIQIVHITPKKVFNLVSWREHICNWSEIHRFDYDPLPSYVPSLSTCIYLGEVHLLLFYQSWFLLLFQMSKFLFFSRLCLPSILK